MSAAQHPRSRLGRALTLARLALLWERLAGVWAPPLLAAGLVAVAAVWGGLEPLTRPMRVAAVAAVFVAALAIALVNLLRLRWPRAEEARARVEAASDDDDDTLALGDPALWALHLQQRAEALAAARVVRAGTGLAAADPFALRYALAVAAALGFLAVGWSTGSVRVAEAFQPVRETGGHAAVMLSRAGDAAEGGWRQAGVAMHAWLGPKPPSPAQSSAQIPGRPRMRPASSRP